MTAVVVQKLSDIDAFIVSDLDGATTLARTMTYLFASFELQIGGASGGGSSALEGSST